MKHTNRLPKCAAAAALAFLTLFGATLSGCSKSEEATADYDGGYYEYYTESAAEYEEEPMWNTEEYNHIDENVFHSVAANPLSTFSADVDTASYSNMRRMVNAGQLPYADSIRIEELLNYFYYDLPEPDGDEPFSVNYEMTNCPWNADTKLLFIGLQAKKLDKEQLPPSNLVFLVDVSGSMDSPNKLPLVQQAFRLLTEQLRPEDRISLVTYASADKVVIDGASGEDGPEILAAVDSLTAGGGTAGAAGITTAYAIAEKNFIPGGNNRIILATDGDLNIGISSEGALTRLVEKKRESGVNLSVLGFGTGNIKDNKMEALADNGNGNYYYIDSVSEARKVLVENMGGTLFTVAKDVKLQVAFNPATLKGYRLIGYENRIMADEDFANDEKDAGEIGAGHRVVVLYELVEKDSPYEVPEPDTVYQQDVDTGSGDYLTLSLRYKEPDGDESKLLQYAMDKKILKKELSPNMKLAAAVAEVGMLLRESSFSGTSSYESAAELLKGCPDILDDEYKLDFLNIISRLEAMSSYDADDAYDAE